MSLRLLVPPLLVEGGAATISAAADSVLKSVPVKLTITGQPGEQYNVTYDEGAFSVPTGQLGLPTTTPISPVNKIEGFYFTMPNTGKVEFAVKAELVNDTEKITVNKYGDTKKKASVTIKFEKGTLSAKADAASYFVGDVVKITGTTTAC